MEQNTSVHVSRAIAVSISRDTVRDEIQTVVRSRETASPVLAGSQANLTKRQESKSSTLSHSFSGRLIWSL